MIKSWNEFIKESKEYPYYNEDNVNKYPIIENYNKKIKEITLDLDKIWNKITNYTLGEILENNTLLESIKHRLEINKETSFKSYKDIQYFIENLSDEEYEEKYDGDSPIDLVIDDMDKFVNDKIDFLESFLSNIDNMIFYYNESKFKNNTNKGNIDIY